MERGRIPSLNIRRALAVRSQRVPSHTGSAMQWPPPRVWGRDTLSPLDERSRIGRAAGRLPAPRAWTEPGVPRSWGRRPRGLPTLRRLRGRFARWPCALPGRAWFPPSAGSGKPQSARPSGTPLRVSPGPDVCRLCPSASSRERVARACAAQPRATGEAPVPQLGAQRSESFADVAPAPDLGVLRAPSRERRRGRERPLAGRGLLTSLRAREGGFQPKRRTPGSVRISAKQRRISKYECVIAFLFC